MILLLAWSSWPQKLKKERLDREVRHQEWMEQERVKVERMQQAEKEKKRLEGLETEVDSWHKSQRIRAYVEAARQYFIRRDGTIETGSEIDLWIQWALQRADRLDPLA